MKYFRSGDNVFGFDETDETQFLLIDAAIAAGHKDITGSWPPPLSSSQKVASGSASIQSALDDAAVEWGYDNIIAAASYTTSTNDKFKLEAIALSKWRDDVWVWAEQHLSVLVNQNPPPTDEAILSAMPAQPARPII